MPIEQQQLAKEAVKNVALETSQSRKDARLQRAAERTALFAKSQGSADLGLRALAYNEGEGMRQGKDWKEAKKRAEDWRVKAKTKTSSRMEYIRTVREARQAGKSASETVADLQTKWAERKATKQERNEIHQARKDMDALESKHKGAIDKEEERLIHEAVQKNGALSEGDFVKISEQARTNIAAAVQLEQMQKDKVLQETEKNPVVDEILREKIAEVQVKSKKPLTPEEIKAMRDQTVNELADKAMDKIRKDSLKFEEVEQRVLDHPQFSEAFLTALGGVDIVTATPDQIKKARAQAMDETRQLVVKEDEAKRMVAEKETAALRKAPEWKNAYAKLLNQEISSGTALTSMKREELQEQADRIVKTERAEKEVSDKNADLAEKRTARAEADLRVKLTGLHLQAKQAEEALAAATTEKDRKKLTEASTKAAAALTKELDKHKQAAETARKKAKDDPKNADKQKDAEQKEERARSLVELNTQLQSKLTSAELEEAATTEKDARDDLKREETEAEKIVQQAELQHNLLKQTSVDIGSLPTKLSDLSPDAVKNINKALMSGTAEEQKQAIEEYKQKNKDSTVGSILGIILAALISGIGEVPDGVTQ